MIGAKHAETAKERKTEAMRSFCSMAGPVDASDRRRASKVFISNTLGIYTTVYKNIEPQSLASKSLRKNDLG
jgi:hypothetical protein